MADEQVATTEQPPQQQFLMQRIYIKDLSFESPSTPQLFKKQWQPKITVDLNTKGDAIDDQGNFEDVRTITMISKGED